MTDNTEYAYSRLCDLSTHVFLTGDAGTGKSTLARRFIQEHEGECLVCAPTGLAAVNIGGSTIHSLFGFPTIPVNYASIKKLDLNNSQDANKISIFKAAKYLFIDEISMTRADLMDQIAWFLFKNSKVICGQDSVPFAGIKIIMIGDLSQLEPVVATDKEKAMFALDLSPGMPPPRYKSAFFFDAACWDQERHASFETIRLNKIWRQNNPRFIEILNEIKHNKLSPFTIDSLNRSCIRPENNGITLCSINADAALINKLKLSAEPGDEVNILGDISGIFPVSAMPVECHLNIKIGCRVMCIKNSNSYYNGSMGEVVEYDIENKELDAQGNEINNRALIIKLDDNRIIKVLRHTFENIDYGYDEAQDRLKKKLIGTFTQFPVKLAYAISIHKSQGQTYDAVNIDFGERGAFAHGQAYVAISRCRTLDGITFKRPIRPRDIIYNNRVKEFNSLTV